MPAHLIDGKSIAKRIRADVRARVHALGRTPGLAVILVGDDAASHLYVGLKERACAEADIRMEKFLFPADVSSSTLLEAVADLNARKDVDAILIQLPLPAPLEEEAIVSAMDPAKDADGFHPSNVAAFMERTSARAPGLVEGIMTLIRSAGEPLKGKRAAVVANSETFFAPLAKALDREGALTDFVRAGSPVLSERLRESDIVVVAVGRSRLITGDMLRPGAIVIDVGTNRESGKVTGDVDAASASAVAGHLTPVPGGVGPVTVAMLLKSTIELAERNAVENEE